MICADFSLYQQIAVTFLSPLQQLDIFLETHAFKINSGTRKRGVLKSEDGERALVRRENSNMKKDSQTSGCRFVFYWKSWASC